jgi:hypothetical protein
MNGQDIPGTGDQESAINALLDGELDEAAATQLKTRAAADSSLSQAIIEAWALQRALETLPLEKAPASLSRRLRTIPRQQARLSRRPWFGPPRWAIAAGLASVTLVAVAMMMNGPSGLGPGLSPGPSQAIKQQASSVPVGDAARVAQARHDLAIAFHYLDKTGFRVARHMNEVLNREVAEPVRDELNHRLPFSGRNRKEENA